MPQVSLVGVDRAGGIITGPGASKLTVNGIKVSLLGDAVAGHGDGAHRGPRMVQGSPKLTVGGIPVVFEGHAASCSHTASGSGKIWLGGSGIPVDPDVPGSGDDRHENVPGPSTPDKGTEQEGSYGPVYPEDFITPTELASRIGLTAGIAFNPWAWWSKMALDGKILFVASAPMRRSISWNQINAVGAVFGEKTIVINSRTYKVRLLKGAGSGNIETASGHDLAFTWGSEWNRLMYPLVPRPKVTPTYPVSQEGITYGSWGIWTEQLMHVGQGDGSGSWCQEGVGDLKLHRGQIALTHSGTLSSSSPSVFMGWRPVLELVE